MQNISPGLVENDILTTHGSDNNEFVRYMPRLKPEDVAKAVIFAITMPADVLVSIFCDISRILSRRLTLFSCKTCSVFK